MAPPYYPSFRIVRKEKVTRTIIIVINGCVVLRLKDGRMAGRHLSVVSG